MAPSRITSIVTPIKSNKKIEIKRQPDFSTSTSSIYDYIIPHTKSTSASSQSAISKSKVQETNPRDKEYYNIIAEYGMVWLQTNL